MIVDTHTVRLQLMVQLQVSCTVSSKEVGTCSSTHTITHRIRTDLLQCAVAARAARVRHQASHAAPVSSS